MRALIAAFALLWSFGAQAVNFAGVEVPGRMFATDGSEDIWSLQGYASVHRSFIPFYGIALHAQGGNLDPDQLAVGLTPMRLTLVWFVPELPRAQVEAHFRKQFERATPEELARIRPRMDKFLAALPDARRGGTIIIDYSPDAGTRLSVDGVDKGGFPGIDFNRALLSLWFGEHADAVARNQLLGREAPPKF